MADIEKTKYDILWYLNEYPNERNATDEIIRESLKLGFNDYQKAKDELIIFGQIEKRADNKNNEAWRLTDAGRAWFKKLKDELKIKNPDALEKTDQLNEVLIALHKSQITLNEVQTSSFKTENKRTYIVASLGIICTLLAAIVPQILTKNHQDKPEHIYLQITTQNAAIDTAFVRTDTIEKK